MNLTDDQLREALHARAQRIDPPLEVFTQVEARARRVHRRRVAGAVAGVAAAVIAVAVIVPTLVLSGGSTQAPVTGPSPTNAPSGGVTPTPSPSVSPTVPAGYALDPAQPWAYRGDEKVRTESLAAFQSAWSTRHPGSTMVPLFGEVYEPSGQPEFVFVAQTSDGPRWGFAMKRTSGIDVLVDRPLAAGTVSLVAAVPGDEVARLIAVAAPDVQAIQYAGNGTTFRDMTWIAPGVAVIPLEGDTAVDQVRVLGTDGMPVETVAAPDPSTG